MGGNPSAAFWEQNDEQPFFLSFDARGLATRPVRFTRFASVPGPR